jgi:hypothetical protein
VVEVVDVVEEVLLVDFCSGMVQPPFQYLKAVLLLIICYAEVDILKCDLIPCLSKFINYMCLRVYNLSRTFVNL